MTTVGALAGARRRRRQTRRARAAAPALGLAPPSDRPSTPRSSCSTARPTPRSTSGRRERSAARGPTGSPASGGPSASPRPPSPTTSPRSSPSTPDWARPRPRRAGPRRPRRSPGRGGAVREHLWSWLPDYLDAVTDLAIPALTDWAELTRRAIAAEFSAQPAWPRLPLALRAAPGAIRRRPRRPVDALTTPVAQRHHPDPPPPGRRRRAGRRRPPDRRAPLHPARHARPGSGRHPGLGSRTRRYAGRLGTPAGSPATRWPAGGRHAPGAPGCSYGRPASGRAEGGTGDRMIMARPASSGST